jgi:hypothetical protein
MEPDKLRVVVGVDLDGNTARIKVRGNVDTSNVCALYGVARRANALTPGLEIVVDLANASATAGALDQLRNCEDSGKLPAAAGPGRIECNLHVLQPSRTAAAAASTTGDLALAA